MLIGEMSRRSGVSTRMLRHYDALGLVRPTGRTVGNYREYSEDDIRRTFHVEGLRSLGLSLRQIGQALANPAFAPSELLGDLIRRTEERLRRDQELLERLRTIDASAPFDWYGVLRVVELLHGLNSPSAASRQQAVLAPTEDVPADVLARAALAEDDPHVAGALRWALARADGLPVELVNGMSSNDVQVRRRAVRAITAIQTDEATAVLDEALNDPDPAVRRLAARALGSRGSTKAVPALVEMIVVGANDVEAAEILGVLAQDQPELIAAAILNELDADTAVRIRLAQAAVELPPVIARRILTELTKYPDVARVAAALLTVVAEITSAAENRR